MIVIIILHIYVSVVCMFIWQTHVGFGLVVLPVNHMILATMEFIHIQTYVCGGIGY